MYKRQVYKDSTNAHLNLKRNGKRVKGIKVTGANEGEFQANLNSIIKDKILNYKNKVVEIATATVTPRISVNYGSLIQTLDTLRKNEIVNIGVLTAKGR